MKETLEKITAWWALLGGLLLLIIVGVTMVNVLGFISNMVVRPFGGYVSGVPGYEDGTALLAGVAALSFFPYCHLNNGHVSVDLFSNMFAHGVQRVIEIISNLISASIAFFLGFMMIFGALQLKSDAALSPVLNWPVWPFFIPGVISCLLWGVVALGGAFWGDKFAENQR